MARYVQYNRDKIPYPMSSWLEFMDKHKAILQDKNVDKIRYIEQKPVDNRFRGTSMETVDVAELQYDVDFLKARAYEELIKVRNPELTMEQFQQVGFAIQCLSQVGCSELAEYLKVVREAKIEQIKNQRKT